MARPADPRRRDAERYGRRAETLAALLLICQGFRILARRVRGTGPVRLRLAERPEAGAP